MSAKGDAGEAFELAFLSVVYLVLIFMGPALALYNLKERLTGFSRRAEK